MCVSLYSICISACPHYLMYILVVLPLPFPFIYIYIEHIDHLGLSAYILMRSKEKGPLSCALPNFCLSSSTSTSPLPYLLQPKIREFVHSIEMSIITSLRHWNLVGEHSEHTGVWIGHRKIAALGESSELNQIALILIFCFRCAAL